MVWRREKALSRAKNQALDYLAHYVVRILTTLSWIPVKLHRAESIKHLQWQPVCQQAYRHKVTVNWLALLSGPFFIYISKLNTKFH